MKKFITAMAVALLLAGCVSEPKINWNGILSKDPVEETMAAMERLEQHRKEKQQQQAEQQMGK
jgi:outer membrane murein-binding lipoprotein Lpp